MAIPERIKRQNLLSGSLNIFQAREGVGCFFRGVTVTSIVDGQQDNGQSSSTEVEMLMQPRSRWRFALVLFSSLAFLAMTVEGTRGFFVRDGLQWDPPVIHNYHGIGACFKTYEICAARGVVCFDFTSEQWTSDSVSRKVQWFYYNFLPISLFADPSSYDHVNIHFAGFQFYKGVFPGADPRMRDHTVYKTIIPLWPLLILTAIPPVIFWRRRRAGRTRALAATTSTNAALNSVMVPAT